MTKSRYGVDRGQLVPGRQRDDQIAMNAPPARSPSRSGRHSPERAKAATARSISPASRTLIGLTSTPSDGATAWMAANWPIPAAMAGSRRTAARVTPGAICFEQLQPFPAQAVFEHRETSGVAARPRQAVDEAGADRIGDVANTIGTVRVACSNGPTAAPPAARMTSGASATSSAACLRIAAASPAAQRVSIRTLRPIGPAQLRQPLQERREAGLQFRIVRGCGHEHADAPHPLGCCARAASGHAAAAPPRTPRNSRRLMSAPRLRRRHRIGSNECFDRAETGFCNGP